MLSLAKIVGLVMVLLLPGGIVLLCACFLARAIRHLWRAQARPRKLRKVIATLSFRDVWREVRAAL